MNLSEEDHFSKRPERSQRGPVPHYHGPPEASLRPKDPLIPVVSTAITGKTSSNGAVPDSDSDADGRSGKADNQRRSTRRPPPEYSKKDLVDLGPHYTKGQHFDMDSNEKTRDHPLFRIDGKNKPRMFTGY